MAAHHSLNQTEFGSQTRFEVVPGTASGSEEVNYSLVGHGGSPGSHHESARFNTLNSALSYMEQRGLGHYQPPDPSRPRPAL